MADTYIPTAGIHIEDLPTTDTAKTTDGLIINSNNNTVNQISLGDLLKDTDAKIQANTDLIDRLDTYSYSSSDFNNVTVSNLSLCKLERYGKVVLFYINASLTIPYNASQQQMLTIPSGYRPIAGMYFRFEEQTGSYAVAQVTGSNINARSMATDGTSGWFRTFLVWMTNDDYPS